MQHRAHPRRAPGPAPTAPRTRHFRGEGVLRIRGAGEAHVRLTGRGRLDVGSLEGTAFEFIPAPDAVTGARRFPGPDKMVVVGARGTLVLKGVSLDLTVESDHIDVEARGDFQAVLLPPRARLGRPLVALPVRARLTNR